MQELAKEIDSLRRLVVTVALNHRTTYEKKP